jgi:hypothetical protein
MHDSTSGIEWLHAERGHIQAERRGPGAAVVDVTGIVIYFKVARALLGGATG